MVEVEHRIVLAASPLRVWTALANINDYGRWHPFIRLSGEPAIGAKLGYTFTPIGMKRMLTASATMTCFEKPVRIGWRAGFRGFMVSEELYELSPAITGTELRHRITHDGLLSLFRTHHRRKNVLAAMVETDAALERYLRQSGHALKGPLLTNRASSKGKAHPFRARGK